ncbi:MAG: acyl-CoA thioesterase [bacterium]|nr:acyl-CoA thioesterase [bacterium]
MSVRPFVVSDRVRWSEVDGAGIIYFGAYVRFIELAETEMLRAVGLPYSEVFQRFDIWLPRVHLEFDFFSPARLDQLLEVRSTIERIGTSSITTQMEIWDTSAGVQCASARMIVACVDRATLATRPLPEPIVAALAPYRLPEERRSR